MLRDIQIIDLWLTWLQHNKGRKLVTCEKYRAYANHLLVFLRNEKSKDLLQASSDDLEEFVGIWAHRAGQSPRSRIVLVSAVKGLYRWCVRAGHLSEDPSAKVPYPRAPAPLPLGIEMGNLNKIIASPGIDTFIGLRDTLIMMVLAGCGLRVSGLCNLNEEDLIWTELNNKHLLMIKTTEKGDKQRVVPAPPQVWALMRAYLAHEELRAMDRLVDGGDKVLFVNTLNNHVKEHEYRGEARRLRRAAVRELIQKHGLKAGIPIAQCHPHAFRHCYGTELAEGDVDMLTLQALMGHERGKNTRIYARIAVRKMAKAALVANPLAKIETPVDPLVKEMGLAR